MTHDVDRLMKNILGRAKQASAPLSETGDAGRGKTTQPVGKADDNVIPLQTGARAAENERDIKAQEPVTSIENKPDEKPSSGSGNQAAVQNAINMTVSATGEDPSIEDNFNGKPDEPGTTSVMNYDSGEKYAAYVAMPLEKLSQAVVNKHNALAARIAVGDASPATATKSAAAQTAAAHGAALAATVADDFAVDEASARVKIAQLIGDAEFGAELYANYADRIFKSAGNDDDITAGTSSHEEPDMAGMPGGGGSGPMPAGGGGMGGPPGGGGLDSALASVPMPEGGGGPGGGGPGGGGPGGNDDLLNDLVMAAMEAGYSSDELIAAAQANGAGGAPPPDTAAPGDPLAGGGMMPKMGYDQAVKLYKFGMLIRRHKRAGRFSFDTALDARGKRAESRRGIKDFMVEMLGRGRAD